MALLIKSPRKRIKQKEIEVNYDNNKKKVCGFKSK